MNYVSICDGIGAAHCAAYPLGWRCLWTSEIEAYPIAVVDHHWHLPNLGDMMKITQEQCDAYRPDLLVGGTPCQSFSVAGLRGGLDDPRGNLALRFLQLAGQMRPRWVVWENVPGVLSSGEGRDFGSILGGLAELGYGWSYRVMDAQYFGVAQKRRRVFVVGCLGDWRGAAAVLFERESMSGNPPPRREAGKGIANALTERPDRGGGNSEGQRLIPILSPALKARDGKGPSSDGDGDGDGDGAPLIVTHSLRADGFDASEDGTGRGTPLVVAFDSKGTDPQAGDVSPTMRAMNHSSSHANAGGQVAVAYRTAGDGAMYEEGDATAPLTTATDPSANIMVLPINDAATRHAGTDGSGNQNGKAHGLGVGGPHDPMFTLTKGDKHAVMVRMAVRRITPREAERLQGFPDDYTLITYRKKPAKDGPRYKALGNSMAVPCMRWLFQRIEAVDRMIAR